VAVEHLGNTVATVLLMADVVGRWQSLRVMDEGQLERVSYAAADITTDPSTWTSPRTVTRALSFLERKKLMSPKEFAALRDLYKTAGFKIAGVQNKRMLEVARTSLIDSIRKGHGPDEATFQLQDRLARRGFGKLNPGHARTVVQTNYASANGRASWEALRDRRVRGIIPAFRYHSAMIPTTRETHAAMHGRIYARNHPIWNTWWPPNGYNFYCKVIGVTVNQIRDLRIKPERRWPVIDGKAVRPDRGRLADGSPVNFSGNPATHIRQTAGKRVVKRYKKARRRTR
jgi:SPP1 gp7 family putative phage head morphogenesis protein